MKCERCGHDNVTGTRFCENCGARIMVMDPEVTEVLPPEEDRARATHRICPRCGSLVDGRIGICRACGYDLNAAPVQRPPAAGRYGKQNQKGGVLKMVILGALIGLAVLGIVFGVMYFINGGGDDTDPEESTVPVETGYDTQPTDTYGPDEREEDQTTEGNSSHEDYSVYIDEPEGRLYSSNVPIFYPDSDSRILTERDIRGMSDRQMQKIVNDIYARNGYAFKNADFSGYYSGFNWYRPNTADMDVVKSRMNDYEKQNVEFLTKLIQ